MNDKDMAVTTTVRGLIFGAVACFASALCSAAGGPQIAGIDAGSRMAVDEMRVLASQIEASALQSAGGSESAFGALAERVELFDEEKGRIDSTLLADQLSQLDVAWQPVKRAAQALAESASRMAFVREVAAEYEQGMEPMQRDFLAVADIVRDSKYGSATTSAALKNLVLNERINRNVNRILVGSAANPDAPAELRADTAELVRNIEALTRGDDKQEIRKVTDASAIEALRSAFRRFSGISTSVEEIAESADQLREAAVAREVILTSDQALAEALAALKSATEKLPSGEGQSGAGSYLLAGLLALALLALLVQVGLQYRRALQLKEGVKRVDLALQEIAAGNLTVSVSEETAAIKDIATRINSSARQQRQLVQNIRAPFELSVEEINKIGISARALVEKGKELTRSVGESITAATEMVRTSEGIKASTAEAARTSDRNCQQVAQGYGLTKDMSKASVDVRESVQETSKSAKRQGELIQSVTAAAEYIQALNTKISVVAINTRIEAEKAGEYGRPFLGIAEAIADLLREAGDEGRKIISEVRMLQNMSAENLSSMENTVGTVVTILEYIDRLDSSLEEINSGSAAISSIIRSVDDAAGQSAVSALHMNSSMAQIRERNQDIGKFSDATRLGVARLQRTMRDAAESLGKFKADASPEAAAAEKAALEALEPIGAAPRVYREEDMSALENTGPARARV